MSLSDRRWINPETVRGEKRENYKFRVVVLLIASFFLCRQVDPSNTLNKLVKKLDITLAVFNVNQ